MILKGNSQLLWRRIIGDSNYKNLSRSSATKGALDGGKFRVKEFFFQLLGRQGVFYADEHNSIIGETRNKNERELSH